MNKNVKIAGIAIISCCVGLGTVTLAQKYDSQGNEHTAHASQVTETTITEPHEFFTNVTSFAYHVISQDFIENIESVVHETESVTPEPYVFERLTVTSSEPVTVEEPVILEEESPVIEAPVVEESPNIEEVSEDILNLQNKNLIVSNHWVRLRSGPGTNYDELGVLDAGMTVEFKSYTPGWFELVTGEFVSERYFDVVN